MREVRSAEGFLKAYGDDYKTLLAKAREVCLHTQRTMGAEFIDCVYTRDDSSFGRTIFKEPGKIVNKVLQNGQNPGTQAYLELNDIVGLTVVLRYPDIVSDVIAASRNGLQSENISLSPPEEHRNRGGYYATHVVCSGSFRGEKLNCEIQIKSILHDAWSAKMHDLTYKPTGVLDPKLNALMASVASTIESLEQQSVLIRDMIKANWNVEAKTRRAARHELFTSMLAGAENWRADVPEQLNVLRQKIEDASTQLAAESEDGKTVKDLTEEVKKCCRDRDQVRYAWILAGRIASLRPMPDLVRFFAAQADEWLAIAPELLRDGKIADKEISSVPLMYYVIGDLDLAIECAEYLAADSKFALSEQTKRIIAFNRATFMIEREYHLPTRHVPTRTKLKKEVEEILAGMAKTDAAVLEQRDY